MGIPAGDLKHSITVPGLMLLGRVLPPVKKKPSEASMSVMKMYKPKNIVVSLETSVERL